MHETLKAPFASLFHCPRHGLLLVTSWPLIAKYIYFCFVLANGTYVTVFQCGSSSIVERFLVAPVASSFCDEVQ